MGIEGLQLKGIKEEDIDDNDGRSWVAFAKWLDMGSIFSLSMFPSFWLLLISFTNSMKSPSGKRRKDKSSSR